MADITTARQEADALSAESAADWKRAKHLLDLVDSAIVNGVDPRHAIADLNECLIAYWKSHHRAVDAHMQAIKLEQACAEQDCAPPSWRDMSDPARPADGTYCWIVESGRVEPYLVVYGAPKEHYPAEWYGPREWPPYRPTHWMPAALPPLP